MKRFTDLLHSKRLRRAAVRVSVCGALLALPACAIPDLRGPLPGPATPPVYPEGFNKSNSVENSASLSFREFFQDEDLACLIELALGNNLELKIRNEDVAIASNEILARRGAYAPSVRLGGRAGLDHASKYTREGAVDEQLEILPGKPIPDPLPDFLVAANVSWQLDIWRQLRNARDAARQTFFATAEGRNYFVTRLVADIAENYYALLALDRRLKILDQTIKLQEDSRKIAEAKKNAGRGTELAVQRFQAEVQKNQSEKLIVTQEIVEVENRINFLVGRYPQHVKRSAQDFLDLKLTALQVGVPAQLLQNRPDIREAARELEAAGLEVKVAWADFLPSLNINGDLGYRAFNPRYLFNPESFFTNAVGELVGPLINRRAIRAAYQTANARQIQAVYNFQQTVLNAFTEVVNRVAATENYRRSVELKQEQLKSLEASVDAATKLFQNARAEYSEVLFAQRDLLEARTVILETKRQQIAAVVNAYQALGGGNWAAPPAPVPADNDPLPRSHPGH